MVKDWGKPIGADRALPARDDSRGMLNSFDKVQANGQAVAPAGSEAGGAKPASVRFGPLEALAARKWLVVLFSVIMGAVAVSFQLPAEAAAAAWLAFAAGAAIIPRAGIPAPYRPLILASRASSEPVLIAASIIEALPEPAILLSRDGAILSSNAKADDLFGALKPGAHISSALRSPQVLDAVTACGPENKRQTVAFSDRVPIERHMAATVSCLSPKSGKDPAILLFVRDLTEQRRLDQLRSDFIANASHEIKTPLASLIGFIETLRGAARYDEAARERFLPIMAKQAERMARLIDNLMSLSRVQMRAHLKPQALVNISDLVVQACNALEPMASEANIRVKVSEFEDATVLGDRDELTQVFINLVHNAIKYGHAGGDVSVRLERTETGAGSAIAISVEDDGPGIPAQHLPRVTERFYRVPGSQALERGGTGLGLAIVKHVVNRHRGELRISSEIGAGSKFTVILAEHKPDRARR
jgi:two-component system, OmpR family, phosphate regulon sensor histidine kinase PhoR